MTKFYHKYAAQNVFIFACNRNKTPATRNGFYDATLDVEEIERQFADTSFIPGIPTGDQNGLVVIDIDNKDYISVDDTIEKVIEEFGPLPETLKIKTQGGGLHYYYRIEEPTQTKTASRFLDKRLPVDIRSNGGYVCGPSDSEGLYHPLDIDDDVFWNDLRSVCAILPEWIENYQRKRDESPQKQTENLSHDEIVEIRSALSYINPSEYDTWIRVGQCLMSTRSPSGFYLWDEWSKKCKDKYKSDEMEAKWKSFERVSDLTIASLFHEAKKNGWVTTYAKQTPIADINLDDIDEKKNHEKLPFPSHLLKPQGIVGDIINHIEQYSKKPQPILALGAAICAAGALMGQRFQTDQGLRTNIYSLGVGESGCGKDAARSAIKRLFENAGIGDIAGTEDLASDSAVITTLSEYPSQIFLIDEIGRFLKITNQATKNSHLYNIISVLLKIYSSANQEFRGKSYADNANKRVIDSPNLCIYGTTVPRSLFEGLTVENITDGFLSRFLIFESEDPDPEPIGRRKFAKQKVDDSLIQRIIDIHKTPRNIIDKGNIAKNEKVRPQIVHMCEDAEELSIEYERYIYGKRKQIRKKESSIDAVYSRAPQFVEQIALIIAVGKNYVNPIIEFEDIQYAIELINYLTDRMHFIAMHHISNNDFESNVKKVLNMIRDYGKMGMTRSQFTKKTQYLSKFVRDDILENLINSEQVKIATRENGRQIIYPIKESL